MGNVPNQTNSRKTERNKTAGSCGLLVATSRGPRGTRRLLLLLVPAPCPLPPAQTLTQTRQSLRSDPIRSGPAMATRVWLSALLLAFLLAASPFTQGNSHAPPLLLSPFRRSDPLRHLALSRISRGSWARSVLSYPSRFENRARRGPWG